MILPPKGMRKLPGTNDDAQYVRCAEDDVRRLMRNVNLTKDSSVLDVGCDTGRLAVGLIKVFGTIRRYEGLDIQERSIRWAQENIQKADSNFRFRHLDIRNERYNPQGAITLREGWEFPYEPGSFDLIFLYSVFTHLDLDSACTYLADFPRVLAPGGSVVLTAYIEEDVPDVVVNPKDYRPRTSGPLHRVRYSRQYFASLAEQRGLRPVGLTDGEGYDRQRFLYLEHPER